MSIENTKSKRNCSIDIFRLLFAIYVVAIHSTPAVLESLPLLDTTLSSLFRFAVPFFLMVSGYYFFANVEKNTSRSGLTSYLKKIIVIYAFWSVPYFVINFISWGHTSLVGFAIDCVYSFFLRGSYYHLWYFPALIFAVCISAALYGLKLKRFLILIAAVLYSACYIISTYNLLSAVPLATPVISILQPLTSGLFYFSCGQLIKYFYDKFADSSKRNGLRYILPLSVIIWFATIWLDYFYTLQLDFIIILGIYLNVGLIVLVLLFHPMPQLASTAKKCRFVANFTYYAHPIFLFIIETIRKNWFSFSDFWYLPVTVFLCLTAGLILHKANSKVINRFIG